MNQPNSPLALTGGTSETVSDPLLEEIKRIRNGLPALPVSMVDEELAAGPWRRLRRYVPIFLILGWLIYNTYTFLNPQSGQSDFVIGAPVITGPTDLCPGDSLNFEFDVSIKQVGVYNLFMSTWKVEPPPSTIIFSEIQPFVVGSDRSVLIQREWELPLVYHDPANNLDIPMIPGAYIRDIAVTAEGRDTFVQPQQVAFRVRPDCSSNQ